MVSRAKPRHTCSKGLTPLAPQTNPVPTHHLYLTPDSLPHTGPDHHSKPSKRKAGVARPSAPNFWRSRPPKVLVLPRAHFVLRPLSPAPTCFLGAPNPNLSVSPPSQLSLCREPSEPCLSHLGPGSPLHDQPGWLAGACASRAPRLHDNLVSAGSLAIPKASRPFLLPPPPRRLSPVTWPCSEDPAPWRLHAALLEGHLETSPTSRSSRKTAEHRGKRATLSPQRWSSLWLALKASPPFCPVP